MIPHPFYGSRQWRALRIQVLVTQPICVLCRRAAATHVDHVRPHRGDATLFFDLDNLQGLCHSCHSAKTVSRDRGFGKPAGGFGKPLAGTALDGQPTDPEHHWNK